MRRARGFVVLSTVLFAASVAASWIGACSSGSSTDSATTAASSSSGSGGSGGGCPASGCDDGNPCTTDACTAGACVSTPVSGDAAEQTAGDCKKKVCKEGALANQDDDTDLPEDGQDCTVDACSSGHEVHSLKPENDPCTLNGAPGYCMVGVCTIQCDATHPCPDDANPCTVDSCDTTDSKCVYDPLDGVPTPGVETALDCAVSECLVGVDTLVPDDTELPDDGNDCTEDTCEGGVPANTPLAADAACGDSGDKFCDGAGVCGECNDALAHCPFTPPCQLPTCEDHTCGETFSPAGTVIPEQLPGDCTAIVCDGAGALTTAIDDSDPPSDGNDCTLDLCTAGVASHPFQPQLFACAAGQCDGAGLCKNATGQACGLAAECATAICADGFCCDAACEGACDACAASLGASADGTCTVLEATKAGAPTCSPYLCSGVNASCATACAADLDCAPGNYCSSSVCVPVDTNGVACSVGGHCQSGFCADGVCCNGPCGGVCQACTAALKGSGVNGLCGGIALGSDPQNECSAATCMTGSCDGVSACAASSLGTTCGSSVSCVGSIQTNQDTCNGAGVCVDNGTSTCAPYVCGVSACKASCAADADCASGNYCAGVACIAKKVNGVACSATNQCASGNCVDGVCCGSGSCPACQACDVNGAGTCANLAAGTKDTTAPNTCPATQTCDGLGACKDDNGLLCSSASTCVSGNCVDGRCCNSACSASCDACSIAAGGTVNGTCTPVADSAVGTPSCSPYLCNGAIASCPTTCVTTADCAGGFFCNAANLCSGQKADGAVCAAGGECGSGNCVDGVCCNSACSSTCTACSNAKKGAGPNGVCGNIVAGTDPDSECPANQCSDGVCGGLGTCSYHAASSSCGDAASCTNALRTVADTCDGFGTCIDNGTQACGLYACTGTICGTACGTDAECIAAAYCSGGACVPDCAADADCLPAEFCNTTTNKCVSKGANGAVCAAGNQCTSTFCADGVCCGTACNSLCQACTAAKKGSGNDGVCANIANADPDSECPNNECVTGLCNNGLCTNLSNGSTCGSAASCSAGLQTNQDTCNGSGTCVDKGTVACGGFPCVGTTCATTCASDAQCNAGYYCNGSNNCVPDCFQDSDCLPAEYCDTTINECFTRKTNGGTCAAGNQCTSTFCADGVCCGAACNGFCQACTAAKRGTGADGTCGNILNLDPDNECPNNIDCKTGLCNGGLCSNSTNGTACGDAASCVGGLQTNQDTCNASGTCLDKGTALCGGFPCVGTACATVCANDAQCNAGYYCNASAVCVPNCAVDGDCAGSEFCNTPTHKCVTKFVAGGVCTAANQCSSGNCVDGVCCAGACTAACKSCAVPGSLGACTSIPLGSPDDAPVCGGAVGCSGAVSCTCNGGGACKSSNGAACVQAANCVSNVCTANICKGAAGQPCSSGAGCQSGSCSGGFCL